MYFRPREMKAAKGGQHHGQHPACPLPTVPTNFHANQKASCWKSLAGPISEMGSQNGQSTQMASLLFFFFLIKESQMLQLSSQ